MNQKIIQEFNPAIKIHNGTDKKYIKTRIWNMDENDVQEMGYIGQYQIEEVWKRYNKNKNLYVSNYGYVAKINDDEALIIFGEDLFNQFNNEGVIFVNLKKDQKKLIRRCNEVPTNAKKTNASIWLQIDGFYIHRIVAEKFLVKTENSWGVRCIDNNSYNNSVTNLVWIKREEFSKKLFPMSFK